MTALSDLRVFSPIIGNGDFLEDVTRRWWPSYKRTSLALGGDFAASATFSASDQVLEDWLDNRLAGHVVESYAGQVAFNGFINTIRLSYNGLVLVRTLDTVFNNVAVYYTPGTGEPTALTSFNSDSSSVASWGTKDLIYRATRNMSQASAEALRDKILDEQKEPKIITVDVADWDPTQQGVCQVEILGYAHSLDWQHLSVAPAVAATDDADDEIADALSGADFVTAGTIDTNTLQIRQELDYRPAWQRIKEITAEGDTSGNRWIAGCYAGRTLNYNQANTSSIAYFFSVKDRRASGRRRMYDAGNNWVPDPLVVPGQVALVRDILAGRPRASTLLDDPRALFIESVEYSAQGLKLKGANQQIMRLAGLEMAATNIMGAVGKFSSLGSRAGRK